VSVRLIHRELPNMKIETPQTDAHRLHTETPLHPPLGEAGATRECEVQPTSEANKSAFRDLNAFTEYLEQLPPGTSRSKEDIDRQVAEERASWD
jgi:hypothetical protein